MIAEASAPAKEKQSDPRANLVMWKPGQSGNPAGRQKGARNKLGEAFLEALKDDFEEHGVKAIQDVRQDKPDQYLKVIASLLPKDINLNFNDNLGELSDDDVLGQIRELHDRLAPVLAITDERVGEKAGAAKPSGVH